MLDQIMSVPIRCLGHEGREDKNCDRLQETQEQWGAVWDTGWVPGLEKVLEFK
jgi:hypothetical protein